MQGYRIIFVHKYKDSQRLKRKKYRRLLKDEKITVHETVKEGWYYSVPIELLRRKLK